jgi:hypothetical protein
MDNNIRTAPPGGTRYRRIFANHRTGQSWGWAMRRSVHFFSATRCIALARSFSRVLSLCGFSFFFLMIGALAVSQPSVAQTLGNKLRGLSKIDLLIEDLPPEAKDCGVTEQAIRAAIMYPLSSSNLEVVKSPTEQASLYVHVAILYFNANHGCVSAVELSAYTFQEVTFDYSGRRTPAAQVTLWDAGAILSSDRAIHAQDVSAELDDQTKRFLTDWNLDNKPEIGAGKFSSK